MTKEEEADFRRDECRVVLTMIGLLILLIPFSIFPPLALVLAERTPDFMFGILDTVENLEHELEDLEKRREALKKRKEGKC